MTSLTSVTIGKNVTTIGSSAFYNTLLTSIIIPDSVTSMGGDVFSGCKNLKSVKLGSGLTTVGSFYRCIGLESIVIPEGVTTIKEGAFNGCTKLASVTIPASVTTIGKTRSTTVTYGTWISAELKSSGWQFRQISEDRPPTTK